MEESRRIDMLRALALSSMPSVARKPMRTQNSCHVNAYGEQKFAVSVFSAKSDDKEEGELSSDDEALQPGICRAVVENPPLFSYRIAGMGDAAGLDGAGRSEGMLTNGRNMPLVTRTEPGFLIPSGGTSAYVSSCVSIVDKSQLFTAFTAQAPPLIPSHIPEPVHIESELGACPQQSRPDCTQVSCFAKVFNSADSSEGALKGNSEGTPSLIIEPGVPSLPNVPLFPAIRHARSESIWQGSAPLSSLGLPTKVPARGPTINFPSTVSHSSPAVTLGTNGRIEAKLQKDAETFLASLHIPLLNSSIVSSDNEDAFLIKFDDDSDSDGDKKQLSTTSNRNKGFTHSSTQMVKNKHLQSSPAMAGPSGLEVEIHRMKKQIAVMERTRGRTSAPVVTSKPSRVWSMDTTRDTVPSLAGPKSTAHLVTANVLPAPLDLESMRLRIAAKESELQQRRQRLAGRKPENLKGSSHMKGSDGVSVSSIPVSIWSADNSSAPVDSSASKLLPEKAMSGFKKMTSGGVDGIPALALWRGMKMDGESGKSDCIPALASACLTGSALGGLKTNGEPGRADEVSGLALPGHLGSVLGGLKMDGERRGLLGKGDHPKLKDSFTRFEAGAMVSEDSEGHCTEVIANLRNTASNLPTADEVRLVNVTAAESSVAVDFVMKEAVLPNNRPEMPDDDGSCLPSIEKSFMTKRKVDSILTSSPNVDSCMPVSCISLSGTDSAKKRKLSSAAPQSAGSFCVLPSSSLGLLTTSHQAASNLDNSILERPEVAAAAKNCRSLLSVEDGRGLKTSGTSNLNCSLSAENNRVHTTLSWRPVNAIPVHSSRNIERSSTQFVQPALFEFDSQQLEAERETFRHLLEQEVVLDKDLETAQEVRRQCEMKERVARREYREAQWALSAANASCDIINQRKELLLSQIHAAEARHFSMKSRLGQSLFGGGALVPLDKSNDLHTFSVASFPYAVHTSQPAGGSRDVFINYDMSGQALENSSPLSSNMGDIVAVSQLNIEPGVLNTDVEASPVCSLMKEIALDSETQEPTSSCILQIECSKVIVENYVNMEKSDGERGNVESFAVLEGVTAPYQGETESSEPYLVGSRKNAVHGSSSGQMENLASGLLADPLERQNIFVKQISSGDVTDSELVESTLLYDIASLPQISSNTSILGSPVQPTEQAFLDEIKMNEPAASPSWTDDHLVVALKDTHMLSNAEKAMTGDLEHQGKSDTEMFCTTPMPQIVNSISFVDEKLSRSLESCGEAALLAVGHSIQNDTSADISAVHEEACALTLCSEDISDGDHCLGMKTLPVSTFEEGPIIPDKEALLQPEGCLDGMQISRKDSGNAQEFPFEPPEGEEVEALIVHGQKQHLPQRRSSHDVTDKRVKLNLDFLTREGDPRIPDVHSSGNNEIQDSAEQTIVFSGDFQHSIVSAVFDSSSSFEHISGGVDSDEVGCVQVMETVCRSNAVDIRADGTDASPFCSQGENVSIGVDKDGDTTNCRRKNEATCLNSDQPDGKAMELLLLEDVEVSGAEKSQAADQSVPVGGQGLKYGDRPEICSLDLQNVEPQFSQAGQSSSQEEGMNLTTKTAETVEDETDGLSPSATSLAILSHSPKTGAATFDSDERIWELQNTTRTQTSFGVSPHHLRYESPLSIFRSYRLCPQFSGSLQLSCSSNTWSHAVNPFKPLCKFEHRGNCNNDACPWQHADDYTLSPTELESQIQKYTNPSALNSCVGNNTSESFNIDAESVIGVSSSQTLVALATSTSTKSMALSPSLSNQNYSEAAVPIYRTGLYTVKPDSPARACLLPYSLQVSDRPFNSFNSFLLSSTIHRSMHSDVPCLLDASDNQSWVSESSQYTAELAHHRYMGDIQEKLVFTKDGTLHEPIDEEVWLELALHHIDYDVNTDDNRGRDQALFYLSRALEATPSSASLWILYSFLFHNRKENSEENDMFRHAVLYNEGSYELWVLFINSRPDLDSRLEAYEKAIVSLTSKRGHADLDKENLSAFILDIGLQMLYCMCISGRTDDFLSWVDELIHMASAKDDPSLNGSSARCLLLHLTPQDACVLWILCAYFSACEVFPKSIIMRLGCKQDLPHSLNWEKYSKADEVSHKRVMNVFKTAASQGRGCLCLESKSSVVDEDHSWNRMLAVNYVQCVGFYEGLDKAAQLGQQYIGLHPSWLELIVCCAHIDERRNGPTAGLNVFEGMFLQWPKDFPGIQRLWNQYAKNALLWSGKDVAKDVLTKCAGMLGHNSSRQGTNLHSVSKPPVGTISIESLDNIEGTNLRTTPEDSLFQLREYLTDLASVSERQFTGTPMNDESSLVEDSVFALINLALVEALLGDTAASISAMKRGMKVAMCLSDPYYCWREISALKMLFSENFAGWQRANMLELYTLSLLESCKTDYSFLLVLNPLYQNTFKSFKKPHVRKFIEKLLGRPPVDHSILNAILGTSYGPSLLPFDSHGLKEVFHLAEGILEAFPGNVPLVSSLCKMVSQFSRTLKRTHVSAAMWALALLISSLHQSCPVAPEFYWVEAGLLLRKLGGERSLEEYYEHALVKYPFSTALLQGLNDVKTNLQESDSVVQVAKLDGEIAGQTVQIQVGGTY